MKKRTKVILILSLVVLLFLLGVFAIYLTVHNATFGFARTVSEEEATMRMQIVTTAESWLGAKEDNDSHREIIDIYNNHRPLAQGYLVSYQDNWCAAFGSTVAIQCGLTDIIPTECGCERQIKLFQERNSWQEDDAYVPLPGDYIFYSLNHSGTGDCTAWSDHVGIVVGTWRGYIKVIEGNNGDAVAYRYLPVNDSRIRGYGLPDYTSKTGN